MSSRVQRTPTSPRTGVAILAVVVLVLAACGGNKPKPDQIFLMPAPAVYGQGDIDPFNDYDPVSQGKPLRILYATDRAKAGPEDKGFRFYTFERARMLNLGEARVKLALNRDVSWDEALEITLDPDRTENYPLEVADLVEYGALESTISLADEVTVRGPEAGDRFFQAVDDRLAVSERKDVYIYVHGYRVNFENPVLVSAELWHYLGYNGAFIAYSWPTKNSMWAYFADLDSAINSARYLRTLILEVAANTEAERIHVIGYSAGTRLVGRMLADFGIFGSELAERRIRDATALGNVILIGADVDQDILSGYIFDGALRVPSALTLYVSEADGALKFSRKMFRGKERAGELLERRPLSERERAAWEDNPNLRVVDVTFAEGGTGGNGHSYFRSSPWVSSDLLMTLLYDLTPEERGLELEEEMPIWEFPEDYIDKLRESVLEVISSSGAESRSSETGE